MQSSLSPALHQKYRLPGTLIGYRVTMVDHSIEHVMLQGPGRTDARLKMTWDTLRRKYELWPRARAFLVNY